MNRLSNKVALISGGARGIGEYTARLFLEEGASVIIGDKDLSRCKKTIKELQKEGYDCSFVALDVSKESDWIDAISHIESNYQKLDILINNAGLGQGMMADDRVKFYEGSPAGWTSIIDANINGPFNMAYAVVQTMLQQKSGRILNVTKLLII